MGDTYQIAAGVWQFVDLATLETIPLTQGHLEFRHLDDLSHEKIFHFDMPPAIEWNFNLNPRQYMYFINLLYLPGCSPKVKHAIMRRLLRHAHLMKNHLPMEARRYV